MDEKANRTREANYVASVSRSIVGKGLAFARSFVVLLLVTPEDYGIYRYVLAFAAYLPHLHFGVLHHAGVAFPERRAAGDKKQVRALAVGAWQVCVIGGLLEVAVFLLFSLTTPISLELGIVMSLLLFFDLQSAYVVLMLKVKEEFVALAGRQFVLDVGTTVAILTCTWLFGLHGLLVAAVSGGLMMSMLGRRELFPTGWAKPSLTALRKLYASGLRVGGSNFVVEAIGTLDLILLVFLVGEGEPIAGFFALALTLVANVDAITAPISQIELVALSRKKGDVDAEPGALLNALETAVARDSLIALFVVGFAAAAISGLLQVAPDYAPALAAISIMLPATVVRRWKKYGVYTLALSNKLRWAPLCAGLNLVVLTVGYAVVHFRFSDDLSGFALVSLVAAGVTGASLLAIATATIGRMKTGVRLVARLSLAHVPLLAFCAVPYLPHARLSIVAAGIAAAMGAILTFGWLFPEARRDAAQLVKRLGSRVLTLARPR